MKPVTPRLPGRLSGHARWGSWCHSHHGVWPARPSGGGKLALCVVAL